MPSAPGASSTASTSSSSTSTTIMPSKAGIIEASDGARHIPSSTRADGSQRKEIRIRPGYRPPEDVEVYKNRAADAWKNRGSSGGGGVPGAEALRTGQDGGDGTAEGKGKDGGKNAKRREARKRAKEMSGLDGGGDHAGGGKDGGAGGSKTTNGNTSCKDKDKATPSTDAQDTATLPTEAEEAEKKARALRKKLKQARELSEKKDRGAALLPEQFAKVIKIQELIRELDKLGFDADGELKAEGETPVGKDGAKKEERGEGASVGKDAPAP